MPFDLPSPFHLPRFAATVAFTLALGLAAAGEPEGPTLTASAGGSVALPATALELTVRLDAKGESVAAAFDALKALRAKASDRLKQDFAVDPAALAAETPALAEDDDEQRAEYQGGRHGSRLQRAGEEGAEAKPEVRVAQVLKARLPLKARDLADLTLEAEALKTRVNAGLLKLLEEAMGPKAEGEDGGEEAQMMRQLLRQQQREGGGPLQFGFLATVSEEQKQQALADALKQAEAAARRAAKVTGKSEAVLRNLSLSTESPRRYSQYYGEYYEEPDAEAAASGELRGGGVELRYHVKVTATYVLK
ncbi:MAG: SIMPL domain-containing protein [Planctomycetota bacterium]|nr:SIMPL domain-containing protein [Planctomycetota bacterium]